MLQVFLVENHIFHVRTSDHLSAYSENQNSNGHAVLKLYRNSTCLDKCYRLSAIGKKECNRALGCLMWAVAFAVTVALVADLADINVGIVVVVLVDDGVLISLLMLLTFLMTRSGVVINQIKPMGNARVQNLLARRWSAPGDKTSWRNGHE